MLDELESLGTAAKRMKPSRSRVTAWRMMRREPDLGVQIDGENFMWRPCREALSQGKTPAQAAEIGRRLRGRLA